MRPFFCLLVAKTSQPRFPPRLLENATKQLLTRAALIPGGRMGSEALETLPVVQCPGCAEPMQPKGAAPVTRELEDITYVCPKCGAETKRTIKRA
jgi:hypothetical protein